MVDSKGTTPIILLHTTNKFTENRIKIEIFVSLLTHSFPAMGTIKCLKIYISDILGSTVTYFWSI